MQLISILLVIVGILTFLSGAIVFFGSNRADRPTSFWYFFAATLATVWLASVALFCVSGSDDLAVIPTHFHTALISAMLLDVGFLGYGAWDKKFGKATTLVFLAAAIIIGALIVMNPCELYSEIILAPTGNGVKFIIGPIFISYFAYFAAIVPAISTYFYSRFRSARSKRKRIGNLSIMAFYGVSSLVILVANLILPLLGNWSAFWLGPLSLAVVIIAIYYMVLRYKAINLSYIWLRIFSYIVLVATIAIIYMVIFSVIFAALFRGSTPSTEVIALNFIMLIIFISLIPAMSGLTRSISRLILEQHPQHSAKKPAKKPDEKEKPKKS